MPGLRDIVNDNGCDLVEGRRWGRNSPAFGNLFNVPLSHRGGLVGPNRAGLHEKARELFADINARTLSDDSISCGLSEVELPATRGRSRSPQRCARGGIRAARRGQGGAPEGGNRGGSQGKDFEEV